MFEQVGFQESENSFEVGRPRYSIVDTEDNTMDTEDYDLTQDAVFCQPTKHLYRIPGFIAIGPMRSLCHTFAILGFIMIVNIIVKLFECPQISYWTDKIPILAYTMIVLVVFISFVDPGFYQRRVLTRRQYDESKLHNNLYCEHCLTYKTDKVRHCDMCGCCVKHLDHHCDVYGNCIGRPNLICFWVATLVGALSMLFVYFQGFKYINVCMPLTSESSTSIPVN